MDIYYLLPLKQTQFKCFFIIIHKFNIIFTKLLLFKQQNILQYIYKV